MDESQEDAFLAAAADELEATAAAPGVAVGEREQAAEVAASAGLPSGVGEDEFFRGSQAYDAEDRASSRHALAGGSQSPAQDRTPADEPLDSRSPSPGDAPSDAGESQDAPAEHAEDGQPDQHGGSLAGKDLERLNQAIQVLVAARERVPRGPAGPEAAADSHRRVASA